MLKMIKNIAAAGALAVVTSVAANATFLGIDVFSDPGTYNPVALNDNIQLNACGSDVRQSVGPGSTPASNRIFGLCTLTDLSDFTLTWNVTFQGITSTLASYTGANVANGLNATFNTGVGTLFSAVGTYTIGLIVDIPSTNAQFVLPNGWTGSSQCDAGITINGITYGTTPTCSLSFSPNVNGFRNTGYAETNLTIQPASVPEPSSAALLLLPAFAAIALRRRKTRV